jgi:hypothetical protein
MASSAARSSCPEFNWIAQVLYKMPPVLTPSLFVFAPFHLPTFTASTSILKSTALESLPENNHLSLIFGSVYQYVTTSPPSCRSQ